MNSEFKAAPSERLALLRAKLRIGLLLNANFGAFAAIEHLSEERYQALQKNNEVWVILSRARALDLQLSHDPSRPAVLKLPKDYRFGNLKSLADPAMDMDYPGKGPLSQAELDPKICEDILTFCRQARTLPAVIFTKEHEGDEFDSDIWSLVNNTKPQIEKIVHARVPLELAYASQLQVFRDRSDDSEHYAIIIGGSPSQTPIIRLHSACFTGDCLGSMKCDCGPQLHKALETLNEKGGILLYLSQEGRGIGLPNKIRAYHLQDQGFDTVEANLAMGFRDDERDFRIGAEILKSLKVNEVELMTNNPRKVEWLEASGIKVKNRIPIQIASNSENADYLDTKAKKSGHLF